MGVTTRKSTTTKMAEQLVFEFPRKTAFGRADFFVSDSNQRAVDAIEDWANWPLGKLLLIGPVGAGKSHLARIWAELSGATVVQASDLLRQDLEQISTNAVCVENADKIARDVPAQEAFFHLHNLQAEAGQSLLITGRSEPQLWGLTLADIESRIQAAQLVRLNEPDDGLLAAVLIKQFEDCQIAIDPKVVHFLLGRMDRSFGAVRKIVADLDREALAQRRSITVPFVRGVLDSGA